MPPPFAPPTPPSAPPIYTLHRLATLSHTHNPTFSTISPPAPASQPHDASYLSLLSQTETLLRRALIDEELTITRLTSNSQPASSSTTASPPALIAAENSLFNSPAPFIPPATSPLNSLLAFRHLHSRTSETLLSLPSTSETLSTTTASLHTARQLLADERALLAALEKRLSELSDRPVHAKPSANQLAALKKQEKETRARISKVMKQLQRFIITTLTPLLETEEAGGVPAGLIKPGEKKVGGKRQRRIEEMWEKRREEGGGVGEEMQELLEELMNRSVEEKGGWVRVERESASVRFLVRAKVAELHHRDGRRCRLVGFGEGFEDR